MKVNGIDINRFSARQLRYEIEHREVTSKSEWPAALETPAMRKSQKGFKSITVSVAVYGKGKEEVIRNRSNLLAIMYDELEVEIDGYTNHFKCVLDRITVKESIKRKCHEVILKFVGYEFGNEISTTMKNTTDSIEVEGNDSTPCIVEVTASANLASVELTGMAYNQVSGETESIIIKNLKAGKKVVINGEDCTVLQEGVNKFADTELWEFPVLKPGKNMVSCSSDKCTVTMKYKPKYV